MGWVGLSVGFEGVDGLLSKGRSFIRFLPDFED